MTEEEEKRFMICFEGNVYRYRIDRLVNQIDKLERENRILREGLEYYANHNHWTPKCHECLSRTIDDEHEYAKQKLGELSEERREG